MTTLNTSAEIVKGLVSTIIPVYNRPQMIHAAVDSVLAQTYRPIEIILVNDGSSDNTGEVLDRIAREHADTVRVIHRANGGAGLARESGRLAARGEYIQYLDSDDWLLPNKFEDQVAALVRRPDCGIAYGITRLVNERGDTLREPSKWTGQQHEQLFPGLLRDRWWHTHTPLYTRRISDLAGAWPKQRPEDWDLEARMGAHRVKLVHCGTLVSCHRDHDTEGRVSRGNHEAYLRDEAWFLPRLYACAVEAGVPADATEMKHLSRWAFMRARHLGAIGESELANSLYRLALAAAPRFSASLRTAGVLAAVVGWKTVGKVSMLRERLPV
ncbi:MAG: glycosyltransferase family 2 protein [Halioglobus sp.]|nr:glycosyltransferase family 2 protein [Halioglobus sp.]